MQPLLDHTIGGKNENLKSKIFRILTFVIAITSLIISISGLSFANKVWSWLYPSISIGISRKFLIPF